MISCFFQIVLHGWGVEAEYGKHELLIRKVRPMTEQWQVKKKKSKEANNPERLQDCDSEICSPARGQSECREQVRVAWWEDEQGDTERPSKRRKLLIFKSYTHGNIINDKSKAEMTEVDYLWKSLASLIWLDSSYLVIYDMKMGVNRPSISWVLKS